MADKSINELPAASQVTPSDLFVLQQSNAAKKLTGQVLENWLVALADGHGGIQSIIYQSTSGLVDTYRVTLADTTTFDFTVTNGKSITAISKTATVGLVDTYTIAYNDGTHTTFQVANGRGIENFEKVSSVGLADTYKFYYNDGTNSTFTVTNGAKGDKGDNSYVWIRYASQKPTEASHDFGVLPDDWMGVYSGYSATAPTDWQEYQWFQIKGEKGNTGNPATVHSYSVEYLASDSGTIIPSGSWQLTVPAIAQGKYLWTRITIRFNTGDPVVAYSVSRYGLDGTGSVSMVNQKSPDSNGNVQITAEDVGALSTSGGAMAGAIAMSGNQITGLAAPAEATDAVNKEYVDRLYPVGSIYMSTSDVSPASFIGGAWEKIEGRYLVGTGNNGDGTTYTAGETGGAAHVKMDVSNLPGSTVIFASRNSGEWSTGRWDNHTGDSAYGAVPLDQVGSWHDQPISTIPPYYAVNVWRRIA